jgi:hypothetical protein
MILLELVQSSKTLRAHIVGSATGHHAKPHLQTVDLVVRPTTWASPARAQRGSGASPCWGVPRNWEERRSGRQRARAIDESEDVLSCCAKSSRPLFGRAMVALEEALVQRENLGLGGGGEGTGRKGPGVRIGESASGRCASDGPKAPLESRDGSPTYGPKARL